MFDVEFLLSPPAAIERSVVYRYRSGMLRGPLKSALRLVTEQDGSTLFRCTPSELPAVCAGGGLFSSIGLCEWPAGQNGASQLEAALVLQAICAAGSQPVVVFLQEGHPLLKQARWPDVEQACLVIEEPVVLPATLASILEYLVRRSKVIADDALLGQAAFRRHFDDLVSNHESMDLPSFRQEFDRAVLLHVDSKFGAFFRESALGEQQAGRNSILRPLRGLVEMEDPLQLSDLLRGLAVRFPSGRNGRELADELAKHTQSFLKSKATDHSSEARRGYRHAQRGFSRHRGQATNVLVWTAVLLAWTPRLSQLGLQEVGGRAVADVSLVKVDQMGREFLRRASRNDDADPLSELWSELEQVGLHARLEDEETNTAQGKLVRLLTSHLEQSLSIEPRWVARLRMTLTDETAMVGNEKDGETTCSSERRERPPQYTPGSFPDVIGHQVAVEGLRGRLQERENSTPIILCGPEGVGRKTLGRLYAKGLLCEGASDVSAPPCGHCESCKQFGTGSLFDFIEFDASAPYAPGYVQKKLLKAIRYASFARHRPVIIANPDKAPRLVDMCLKTLEAHSEITRFVFTVTDLKAMSATGQSRCDVYRLAPLTHEDAKHLGKRFLERSGLSCDERTTDLVISQAGGLPRRLLELCNSVSSSNPTTVEEVRRALNLSWAEEAVAYWRALLAREEPDDDRLKLPIGWQPCEGVGRVRSILAEMYSVYATGRSRHPALTYLDGDPVSGLASLLHDRAVEVGVSFPDLWAALSRSWIADEQLGRIGFLEAGLKSRAIIGMQDLLT